MGPEAAGSATTITRLLRVWQEEYALWRNRSLEGRDHVYIWADGIHFQVRLEEDRLACLVILGVLPDGRKEIIALEDEYRESTESWLSILRDLQRRGLVAPVLAIGDGALGFWAALREVYPQTQEQRCWKHKVANLWTTNPIESPFATVKARTKKTKGAGSRKAGLAMAFKLLLAACCQSQCRLPSWANYHYPSEISDGANHKGR